MPRSTTTCRPRTGSDRPASGRPSFPARVAPTTAWSLALPSPAELSPPYLQALVPDYDAGELLSIFVLFAQRAGAMVKPAGRDQIAKDLGRLPCARTFASGRTVRNLLERLLAAHAAGLHTTDRPDDELRTHAEADVKASLAVASRRPVPRLRVTGPARRSRPLRS
jgi:hypothetical protein